MRRSRRELLRRSGNVYTGIPQLCGSWQMERELIKVLTRGNEAP